MAPSTGTNGPWPPGTPHGTLVSGAEHACPQARETTIKLLRRRPLRDDPGRSSGHGASPRGARDGGQSLVEFSLVLAPLLLILLGVIQFGFVFNTYVTMSTAAREAAREGSIYVYDRTITKSVNDAARNNRIKAALLASLNGLVKTAPQFANGASWTSAVSGTTTTYTNGDIQITYTLPAGVTDNDPRQGYRITVKATYHQDLIVPIVDVFLPQDANGRLPLAGEVTMVVN